MNYQCLPIKEAVCEKVVFPEITDFNPVKSQKKWHNTTNCQGGTWIEMLTFEEKIV